LNDLNTIEILLVEDNARDAEMTIRALRKNNFPNKLFWVEDGVDALDFIRCTGRFTTRKPANSLKLVLLDLKMPRLDGLDVLKALKADPATRSIPVVVMTSSNEERDVAGSYDLGVNGYVTKPVEFTSFMEQVSHIGSFWLLENQRPSV
jgi:two-component system response regulator